MIREVPMSFDIVKNELKRFIQSPDPETICVFGTWGIGKTYTWKSLLRENASEGNSRMQEHSYVSLFGLNSIHEVKMEIVQSSKLGNVATSTKGRLNWLVSTSKSLIAKAQRNAPPFVHEFIGANPNLLFAAVREQIVCFDDLERRGDDLSIKDILGLVTLLRDDKKCKVVVLLNYDQLAEARETFTELEEKVFDTKINFEISPAQAASIALRQKLPHRDYVIDCCSLLGITNIRVGKSLDRFLARLETIYPNLEDRIFRQAIHSACVYLWAKYSDTGPGTDWLTNFNDVRYAFGDRQRTNEESVWVATLGDYGLSSIDEFDKIVFRCIDTGYIPASAFDEELSKFRKRLEFEDQDASMSRAWALYHDSFDDNLEDVLEGLETAFRSNYRSVTPLNLNGLARIFRELGQPDKSRELVEFYGANMEEPFEFWSLEYNSFADEIDEQIVIDLFSTKANELRPADPTPKEILLRIHSESGWSRRDVDILSKMTPQDFRDLFKSVRGREFRILVNEALRFRGRGGQGSPEFTIWESANSALDLIAAESPINERRVRARRNNAN